MRSGVHRLVALGLLLLIAVIVGVAQEPRGYRPSTAPADEFSAERAFAIVADIAREPHPMGTAAHAEVRARLVDELREMGLQPEIDVGIGRTPGSLQRNIVGIGRVGNIVARIPGTNPSGTVYLTAHYDSVRSAPGANDDSVGVAVVLETVRALHSAAMRPRNDIVVLLTDGEESGLLGAEAFVHDGLQDAQSGIVINHEARGAVGPPILWRVTRPDGGLIRAVAGATRYSGADSLSTAFAAAFTSGDSDFSAFAPGGLAVLDWAYIGDGAYYHNRADNPANVDPDTIQRMGDNTIALTRALSRADLGSLPTADDVSYFQLPGGRLAVFSPWVTVTLAVAAVIGGGVLVCRAHRRSEVTVPGVLTGSLAALAATGVAVAATYGLWRVLTLIRPGYAEMTEPYRPWFFYAAVALLPVAVVIASHALARKKVGTTAASLGMLTFVVACAAALTFAVPTAGHVLAIPAAGAVAGWLVASSLSNRWQPAVMAVALVPSAVLLSGFVWPIIQIGVKSAPFAVVPGVALLTALLTPLLDDAGPIRRPAVVSASVFALVLALSAVGLAVSGFDESHPRPTDLKYALDANSGTAQWISRTEPDDWSGEFVTEARIDDTFEHIWVTASYSGSAPVQDLPAPTVEIISDTTASDRRAIRLRLRSMRGANVIGLQFEDADVRSLRVAGREIIPAPEKGFRFYAPPVEGVEVEMVTAPGPLTLRAIDYKWLADSGITSFRPPPPDMYLLQSSESAVFRTLTV